MANSIHGRGVIPLSLFLMTVLQILPVPVLLESFRPDWVLACLIYWCMALPYRTNIGTAFIVGLILDILLGSTIGVHALAMAIIAYISAVNFLKLRNFSVWQQALIVGILTLTCRLIVFWAEYTVQSVHLYWGFLYPALTTVLIWPWMFMILRKIRRQFRLG